MAEVTKTTEIKVKRVLICCNGFINTNNHNLAAFQEYFNSLNKNASNEVVLVSLYDPQDKKTYSRKKQLKVLHDKVKEYADKNYIIYLLGYSYTAGICAHVTSMLPEHIRKIILISPTIYLIKTRLLFSYLKVAAKYIKLQLIHRNRMKKTISKSHMQGVIPISYNIALSIFKNRKYFKKVRCRVFVGKAQNDELCLGKTLWKITHKLMQSRVTIKSYLEGGHTMIMGIEYGKPAFDDILTFAFHMDNPEDKKDEDDEKQATLSFSAIKD